MTGLGRISGKQNREDKESEVRRCPDRTLAESLGQQNRDPSGPGLWLILSVSSQLSSPPPPPSQSPPLPQAAEVPWALDL